MVLIELAKRIGIDAKRVATTQGGEYHSSCPICGGRDRFVIHPNKQMKSCMGSYFCRQCDVRGDSIQFCIKFLGYSFKEAAEYVGAKLPEQIPAIFVPKKSESSIMVLNKPSNEWIQQAWEIVQEAHDTMLSQKDILQMLNKRGLPIEAIKKYKIGGLTENKSLYGSGWGLKKDIWLPAGIVVPTIEQENQVIRLKIRRRDWKINDELPKYVAISESMNGLNIIGNKKHSVMVVVESELDAYALHHSVGDFAVIVAVGGCTKKPDPVTDHLARNKTVLLICHDNDDAGNSMFDKWKQLYSHAQRYPTIIGKDIGEAIEQGLDLRAWIIEKLPTQIQNNLHLIKPEWSEEEQALINFIQHYINERTVGGFVYEDLVNEISLSSNSPRAKTGELQNGLRLMKKLIEGGKRI